MYQFSTERMIFTTTKAMHYYHTLKPVLLSVPIHAIPIYTIPIHAVSICAIPICVVLFLFFEAPSPLLAAFAGGVEIRYSTVRPCSCDDKGVLTLFTKDGGSDASSGSGCIFSRDHSMNSASIDRVS